MSGTMNAKKEVNEGLVRLYPRVAVVNVMDNSHNKRWEEEVEK